MPPLVPRLPIIPSIPQIQPTSPVAAIKPIQPVPPVPSLTPPESVHTHPLTPGASPLLGGPHPAQPVNNSANVLKNYVFGGQQPQPITTGDNLPSDVTKPFQFGAPEPAYDPAKGPPTGLSGLADGQLARTQALQQTAQPLAGEGGGPVMGNRSWVGRQMVDLKDWAMHGTTQGDNADYRTPDQKSYDKVDQAVYARNAAVPGSPEYIERQQRNTAIQKAMVDQPNALRALDDSRFKALQPVEQQSEDYGRWFNALPAAQKAQQYQTSQFKAWNASESLKEHMRDQPLQADRTMEELAAMHVGGAALRGAAGAYRGLAGAAPITEAVPGYAARVGMGNLAGQASSATLGRFIGPEAASALGRYAAIPGRYLSGEGALSNTVQAAEGAGRGLLRAIPGMNRVVAPMSTGATVGAGARAAGYAAAPLVAGEVARGLDNRQPDAVDERMTRSDPVRTQLPGVGLANQIAGAYMDRPGDAQRGFFGNYADQVARRTQDMSTIGQKAVQNSEKLPPLIQQGVGKAVGYAAKDIDALSAQPPAAPVAGPSASPMQPTPAPSQLTQQAQQVHQQLSAQNPEAAQSLVGATQALSALPPEQQTPQALAAQVQDQMGREKPTPLEQQGKATVARETGLAPEQAESFWGSLGTGSKVLLGLGVGMVALPLLLRMFGGDNEEGGSGGLGFLGRVLPILGAGAMVWGATGGDHETLPDLNRLGTNDFWSGVQRDTGLIPRTNAPKPGPGVNLAASYKPAG